MPRKNLKQILHHPQQHKESADQRYREQHFLVAKSEQLEITTRSLADNVGKKYGGSAIHTIKNHKKKTTNYPEDINETTATRTYQLIYGAKNVESRIRKNDKFEYFYRVIWGQYTGAMKKN